MRRRLMTAAEGGVTEDEAEMLRWSLVKEDLVLLPGGWGFAKRLSVFDRIRGAARGYPAVSVMRVPSAKSREELLKRLCRYSRSVRNPVFDETGRVYRSERDLWCMASRWAQLLIPEGRPGASSVFRVRCGGPLELRSRRAVFESSVRAWVRDRVFDRPYCIVFCYGACAEAYVMFPEGEPLDSPSGKSFAKCKLSLEEDIARRLLERGIPAAAGVARTLRFAGPLAEKLRETGDRDFELLADDLAAASAVYERKRRESEAACAARRLIKRTSGAETEDAGETEEAEETAAA